MGSTAIIRVKPHCPTSFSKRNRWLNCAVMSISACLISATAHVGFAMEHVEVAGRFLNVAGTPARFFCAQGVALPLPAPAESDDGVFEDTLWVSFANEAENLASLFARSGFNMIRIPTMPVGDSGIQGKNTVAELYDLFVWACKTNNVRVWAELMHPATFYPVQPGDVGSVDEPYSADDWVEAVSGFKKPFEGISAAPWDARTEVVIQQRIHKWARSFNPYSGMRRCDDPVFALWSFEQLWCDDMENLDPATLPVLFTNTLCTAWNNWLYRKFPDDEVLRRQIPCLTESESLHSGSIRYFFSTCVCEYCASRDIEQSFCLRRKLQKVFLSDIYEEHMGRVINKFSILGYSSRSAPRFSTSSIGGKAVGSLSTAEVVKPFERPTTDIRPLVMYPAADNPSYLHLKEASFAVANGISVMAVAVDEKPELNIFASQIFLTSSILDESGKIDKPDLAFLNSAEKGFKKSINFESSDLSLSNIVCFILKQESETNSFVRVDRDDALFTISLQSLDGQPVDTSEKLLLSTYAAEAKTSEPTGFSFEVFLSGLSDKDYELINFNKNISDMEVVSRTNRDSLIISSDRDFMQVLFFKKHSNLKRFLK
jgi:hypothetical protein